MRKIAQGLGGLLAHRHGRPSTLSSEESLLPFSLGSNNSTPTSNITAEPSSRALQDAPLHLAAAHLTNPRYYNQKLGAAVGWDWVWVSPVAACTGGGLGPSTSDSLISGVTAAKQPPDREYEVKQQQASTPIQRCTHCTHRGGGGRQAGH
jgi:hypothetical protein